MNQPNGSADKDSQQLPKPETFDWLAGLNDDDLIRAIFNAGRIKHDDLVYWKVLIKKLRSARSSDAPATVWAVENKTSFALFATEEQAKSYVTQFPCSVSGGLNIAPMSVFGARSAIAPSNTERINLTSNETLDSILNSFDERLWRTANDDVQLRLHSRFEAEMVRKAIESALSARAPTCEFGKCLTEEACAIHEKCLLHRPDRHGHK